MPRGLNKENFGKKAVRRNQLIASLLQRVNLVENMGTGINKIKSLLKGNGNIEPLFEFNSFYTIIFKRENGGINGGINIDEVFLPIIPKSLWVFINLLSNIVILSLLHLSL